MIFKNILFSLTALAFIFGASTSGLAADAEAGKNVFKKCAMCHSPDEGVKKIGPSLFGIIGRTPGTYEGFKFSPAMIAFGESGKVWSESLLDAYLQSPRELVPGNRMGFPGLNDPAQREDVIAYLKTLK